MYTFAIPNLPFNYFYKSHNNHHKFLLNYSWELMTQDINTHFPSFGFSDRLPYHSIALHKLYSGQADNSWLDIEIHGLADIRKTNSVFKTLFCPYFLHTWLSSMVHESMVHDTALFLRNNKLIRSICFMHNACNHISGIIYKI